jgi:hypothetical protein
MPKARSILLSLDVDQAVNAHKCKASEKHALVRGDKRLKVKMPGTQQSPDHYCQPCAMKMIKASIDRLKELEVLLS